jgi:hypothetical protein
MIRQPKNNAEWYDRLLTYILNRHLSRDIPWPQPTSCWPPENVEILEAYSEWRLKGGASELSTRKIYVPTAAQLMGLALKPHQEFDLAKNWLDSDQDTEFSRAYDFVLARNLSNDRIDVHRYALENFRKFLCQERGILEVTITPYDPVPHVTGLPEWLVDALKRYQLIRQRNWRPARLEENIRRFWSGHLRTWRFLCGKGGVRELKDLQRKHVIQYMEFRLKGGYAVSGINGDLHSPGAVPDPRLEGPPAASQVPDR